MDPLGPLSSLLPHPVMVTPFPEWVIGIDLVVGRIITLCPLACWVRAIGMGIAKWPQNLSPPILPPKGREMTEMSAIFKDLKDAGVIVFIISSFSS